MDPASFISSVDKFRTANADSGSNSAAAKQLTVGLANYELRSPARRGAERTHPSAIDLASRPEQRRPR